MELDIDDNQSILLTDTCTHRPLQQNDELFAVEGEDSDDGHDHDEGAVGSDQVKQGERTRESSDDGHDDGAQADGDRQGLMGNIHARRSWVDLSDVGENAVQNGGGTDRPSRGSLSAKAGIILVRSTQNISISSNLLTSHLILPYLRCLGYTQHIRRHSAVPSDRLDRADIRYSGATKVRAPWKPPWHNTAWSEHYYPFFLFHPQRQYCLPGNIPSRQRHS